MNGVLCWQDFALAPPTHSKPRRCTFKNVGHTRNSQNVLYLLLPFKTDLRRLNSLVLICLKSNFNRQLEAWPLWIRDWIHRPTSDIRNVFQKNRRQTPQKHFARQFIGTLLHCMKWNFRYRTYFILSHKDSDKIQFTNINHVQANSYRTPRS